MTIYNDIIYDDDVAKMLAVCDLTGPVLGANR